MLVSLVMVAKVFAPVRESAPAPLWMMFPEPEMSLATVSASERLKISEPALLTAPEPRAPAAPPLPILSVPLLIVVAPL